MASHSLIETLESRRHFSVTLTDGLLQIVGTEGKDKLDVVLDQDDTGTVVITLNDQSFTFNADDIEGASIDMRGGNDTVKFSEKNGRILFDSEIEGGGGNDKIVTGSGDDIINAGAGKDDVNAGAGDDQINGGAGNDKIKAGGDNDDIDAGDGRDDIDAGAGDDEIDGGGGNDKIKAGTGSDAVAYDATNLKEMKDRRSDDQVYRITNLATLGEEIEAAAEQIVPGMEVQQVRLADNVVTLLYTFGEDATVYKAQILLSDTGDFELISREVSLNEAREPALTLFNSLYPNLEIKTILQHPGSRFDIRYVGLDGVIQTVRTENIIWGLDDASEDADNNGYSDGWEFHPDGGDGGGDQVGPVTRPGDPIFNEDDLVLPEGYIYDFFDLDTGNVIFVTRGD